MVKESANIVGYLGFDPWDQKDPLEKGMAARSSVRTWRIPWTEELVGSSPQGCEEVDTTERLSLQFSSVAQSCLTLCNPMNRSMPGLPIHHQLPEFTQTHVH